ncbi:MAG TPA: NifU family protein [Caulobacteraceae bacterium]|nr:NifU family protein [Caulobacteraceae bacterium]
MFIQTEATPNPEVLKFLPGRALLPGASREFTTQAEAAASPLARALFGLEGVTRVYFGDDFLTVMKDPDREWAYLKAPILAEIMDHFTSGAALIEGDEVLADEQVYEGETALVVAEIKELIDTRIRPAVAQDGGDIMFSRFEPATGVVWLNMRGACSSCPSSAATLKSGVENLLRHYVPEVTRVEQTL